MEKHHIDRRVEQMEGEGVTFHCGVNVGVEQAGAELARPATMPCSTAAAARRRATPASRATISPASTTPCPIWCSRTGASAARTSTASAGPRRTILAGGKHVVVVGGGDTASDCVGTSFRQGAVAVTQLDIRPEPPEKEDKLAVWPYWATKMRTSSSQAEGAGASCQAATLEFVGEERTAHRRQVLPGSTRSASRSPAPSSSSGPISPSSPSASPARSKAR